MSELYPRRFADTALTRGPVVAALLAVLCVPFAVQLASTVAGPVPDAMWPVLIMSVWASLMTAGLLGVALAALSWRAWRGARKGFSLPRAALRRGGAGGRR